MASRRCWEGGIVAQGIDRGMAIDAGRIHGGVERYVCRYRRSEGRGSYDLEEEGSLDLYSNGDATEWWSTGCIYLYLVNTDICGV